VASWRTEPARLSGEWRCFRQVSPEWAPLYHGAGEPHPSQVSGRWHRLGDGYAQYMTLDPMGAWAEQVRFEKIRGNTRAEQYTRRLWLMLAREREIADLATFDRYDGCGLDPRIAVGDHAASQDLADELQAAGYRGLLSPNAALVGAINLTLFGARFEKELLVGLDSWANHDPDLRIPCSLVVEGTPPRELITATTFANMPHDGYREWLQANGRPLPPGVP
jgi:hypothetical protein